MKTMRTPALLLGLLYLCFFGSLALSASRLPTHVATHFGAGGRPNGWMSPAAYLLFMTVFGLGFPLFVPAICYVSRFFPQYYNIPHRDYWLAPARRSEVAGYLFRHSLWFASMALCFVMGIHFLTLHTNGLAQAHLSTVLVVTLAGCFLVGTAIWAGSLFRHFNHVA